jgi:hypothetical protein
MNVSGDVVIDSILDDTTARWRAACRAACTMRWFAWNTLHIGPVVEQLRAEGHTIDDATLSLTTPLLRKHINPFGKYHFDLERMRQTADLLPSETP